MDGGQIESKFKGKERVNKDIVGSGGKKFVRKERKIDRYKGWLKWRRK